LRARLCSTTFAAGRTGNAALARYVRLAARYESTTKRIGDIRQRAIDLLELKAGETAFDVACGAGANPGELARRWDLAAALSASNNRLRWPRWHVRPRTGSANVQLLCDPVETSTRRIRPTAVLFCYTHDVLQSPQALSNLFAQGRPGTRIAVAGLCLLPWWGAFANAWVIWRAREYLTTWRGLRAPWLPLLRWCPDLRVVGRSHLGTSYLAAGRLEATCRTSLQCAAARRNL